MPRSKIEHISFGAVQFSVALRLFPMNSRQNELLVVSRSAQLAVSVQMKCSPLIVVRTSSSGAGSLRSLMPGRHPQHAAPILIVQHNGARRSLLPDLLLAVGPIPAQRADDYEPVWSGQKDIAPPDHHIIIVDGCLLLIRDPEKNGARTKMDTLFRGPGESCGPSAIGLTLTRRLNDRITGLREIKRCESIRVVQHPTDANHPKAPSLAAAEAKVECGLPLAHIPGRLYRLVAENGQPATPTRSTRTLDEVRAMNNAKKFELPVTFALCAHPGRIGGPALLACTRPNSPDIHPSTASALALIERGGCWAGTRDSGEKIGKHRRFRVSRSAHSDFSFTKWLRHWSTGSTSRRRVLHQAARHRQLP